ncbi:MAG TPA: PaaI family thioesterase [Zoogloea sp.]|uniref:PaaI family thioesterase n=1 Tax=Zoogloea sp. TaxID=49181 RepID=UPI002C23DAA3|nr:PaaI family thioesterase [Zoogloea sp.]HMV19454.1 PaaI family thioesterase [Rhodocyclaceae bacterium]HMV65077.1 PaaI family thioesterase [Rhodocyclaceae bacterium]HMW51669.1 PaaI family thioesterase [Rhodocyclaceae bacterium]HMY51204.1 PaaI family thioesterase [Rhodocyclaceae bacterium]HMZ77709.1 PaaI family thioesterase [Rhodocyclaceae bacterium]
MAKAIRLRDDIDPATLTARGTGHLPGWYGLSVTELEPGRLRARMTVRPEMLAPNGFLHAASVVALADTSAGYATVAHLPDGATSFTTLELKSNFFATVTEGELVCDATAVHLGRSTQVWDAEVRAADGARLALFRCTQMILWPKAA